MHFWTLTQLPASDCCRRQSGTFRPCKWQIRRWRCKIDPTNVCVAAHFERHGNLLGNQSICQKKEEKQEMNLRCRVWWYNTVSIFPAVLFYSQHLMGGRHSIRADIYPGTRDHFIPQNRARPSIFGWTWCIVSVLIP